MRIFLVATMAALQLATCIGVHAHGDDKPKRGGTMGRGDDSVSIEASPDSSNPPVDRPIDTPDQVELRRRLAVLQFGAAELADAALRSALIEPPKRSITS